MTHGESMDRNHEIIYAKLCDPGQVNDVYIGGGNSTHCQVFLGNAGYYTHVCDVPRRLEALTVGYAMPRYCRELAVPQYLHVLTSPSFPIAVFATIVLYFFLRYLMRASSQKILQGATVAPDRYGPYPVESKKHLRFPNPPNHP